MKKAIDIMTKDVVTVSKDTTVAELANLLTEDAAITDDVEQKVTLYKQAGNYLIQGGETNLAQAAFMQALEHDPNDQELVLGVIRSKIEADELDEAEEIIEQTLARQTERRSPLISMLKHQASRI